MRTTHTYCQRVWWREVINFRETKWVIISNPILLSTCNDRASGARDLVGMKTTPRARSNWFHTSLTWRQWPRQPRRWQIPISPLNPHAVSASYLTVSASATPRFKKVIKVKIGYFISNILIGWNVELPFYHFLECEFLYNSRLLVFKLEGVCMAAPQAGESTRRNELRLGLADTAIRQQWGRAKRSLRATPTN